MANETSAGSSKSLSECSCELWKINIERINAPIILQQIRSGTSFQCDQFQYCPWCGKGLTGSKAAGNETNSPPEEIDPDRLCEDCPPVGYPTNKTRCLSCPRLTGYNP